MSHNASKKKGTNVHTVDTLLGTPNCYHVRTRASTLAARYQMTPWPVGWEPLLYWIEIW